MKYGIINGGRIRKNEELESLLRINNDILLKPKSIIFTLLKNPTGKKPGLETAPEKMGSVTGFGGFKN